ncbi:tetraprenyl-beta-curcumene synthase family protein [Pseudanabaena sp. FACHB-2040]|uniref:tetraprenyl-beta-curcumene synthase family protein n=1 Tax=Pseudanabaena sp. FACHB-2040 TaxID=2692859 RepID=UPI001685DAE0|nr:tetraprenyl-beta-curcumene synthase family protein [Pseudanabaena sp. FACHB-2040]MBD2255986.1 tetraprenyl-beta-curcumene synthase family protein [Pseudanabaena sp. FACHB-2040]
MAIPASPLSLITAAHFKVLPAVRRCLSTWTLQAQKIPNLELRHQALASLETKKFHCEGGGLYSLLAKSHWYEAINFIVAYQTISDYLDNLCDRSTSLDPEDFRALHESLLHALMPDSPSTNYYRVRDDQEDGGYLKSLVSTCQASLRKIPNYSRIAPTLQQLASYYCDLQVHKHVRVEERVPRLKNWFSRYQDKLPDLSWYEFSASAGSTLGVFCLVSSAFDGDFSEDQTKQVERSYFPWVQGLHILLDYLIDQQEDRANGDLNFCFYYPNKDEMMGRFRHFLEQATQSVARLPHARFHKMINQALLGVYLSDHKVQEQPEIQLMAQNLIKLGGRPASFFYWSRLGISQLGASPKAVESYEHAGT